MMSNWRTMADCIRRFFVLALAVFTCAVGASTGLIGRPAPDFALPALVGTNVRLSEYRGQPVILAFWGSGCGVCGRQLAALDKLYATYRSSGLVVLGVSVDDNLQHAQQYAHAHSTAYPLLLDGAKDVSRAFAIDRLPTSVLIDRAGVVRYVHSDDGSDEHSYIAQIRTLLDDKPALP
jgi:peroxiredoxin